MRIGDHDIDEGLDPEGPSAADLDRFGDEFVTCPSCGEDVYDQSPMCPSCGHAFVDQPRGLPWWALVGVVVALITFVLVFVL